jgi:hypothetical protein
MKATLLPSALLLALSLAACNNNQPEVVDSRAPDPMEEALNNAAPVELPPAVKADKTMRCKDNSLIYVTFFEGDKMVNLRTEKGGSPTQLTAPEAGQPLTGGGYTISGSTTSVEYTAPGKTAQTCKA